MAGLSQVSLREMTSYLNLSSSDDSSRSFGLRLWMFRWPMRSPFGWLPPQRCPLLPCRRALGARLARRVRLGGAAAEVSGRPDRSRAAVTGSGPGWEPLGAISRVLQWRPAARASADCSGGHSADSAIPLLPMAPALRLQPFR